MGPTMYFMPVPLFSSYGMNANSFSLDSKTGIFLLHTLASTFCENCLPEAGRTISFVTDHLSVSMELTCVHSPV